MLIFEKKVSVAASVGQYLNLRRDHQKISSLVDESMEFAHITRAFGVEFSVLVRYSQMPTIAFRVLFL